MSCVFDCPNSSIEGSRNEGMLPIGRLLLRDSASASSPICMYVRGRREPGLAAPEAAVEGGDRKSNCESGGSANIYAMFRSDCNHQTIQVDINVQMVVCCCWGIVFAEFFGLKNSIRKIVPHLKAHY